MLLRIAIGDGGATMMGSISLEAAKYSKNFIPLGRRTFVLLAILLIGLGIARSAISTRLDSFTYDEAYHIAAGITYVKFGDFRINPEQPPLVKLWVGTVLNATGFQIGPLRRYNDKGDERDYTESTVFLQNDPDSIQRRARVAMWILNGLLLMALTLAAEHTFGSVVALAALLFLMIDPTVAAHMPVVLMDLPVALTATTGILLAVRVFRDWVWTDVFACSVFLGLALASKHSAPVALMGVVLAGIGSALLQWEDQHDTSRISRILKLGTMLLGALVVLWAFYGFRYAEARGGEESFNRPLSQKIADINSPAYRLVLTAMSKTHVVPRPYVWGFADTVHAGMEGRLYPQLAFGKLYEGNAPWYFFPGAISVKLPIGLGVLSVLGIILFVTGRLPKEWNFASSILLVTLFVFFFVLAHGATYAGIRHALAVVVLLSIFAGIAAAFPHSRWLRVATALAYLAAGISALPVMRPWEYFNEFSGGSQNAYKYFSDEGVDSGQRSKELATYYRQHRRSDSAYPEILYFASESELKARGVDYLGTDMKRDFAAAARPERNGTVFAAPTHIAPKPFWDRAALRNAQPIQRLGNLFVYSGEFNLPGNAAFTLDWYARSKLFAKTPDLEEAEKAFRAAVKLDPAAYFDDVELGNVCLLRGKKELALEAYREALQNVRNDQVTRRALEKQIELVSRENLTKVPSVLDPHNE